MRILNSINEESEIKKIERQIEQIEMQKKDLIYRVGAMYIANSCNNTEKTIYSDTIDMIKKLDINLSVFHDKKLAVKGLIQCKLCGNVMVKDSVFCTKCGGKVENVQQLDQQADCINRCKNCGAELNQDAVFCVECGTKVE